MFASTVCGRVGVLLPAALLCLTGAAPADEPGSPEQRRLYALEMGQAARASESRDWERVHELLGRYRPKPNQPDLRGWEWYCLEALSRTREQPRGRQTLVRELKGGGKWPPPTSPSFHPLAWSPDSRWLAGIAANGQAAVWPAQGGPPHRLLGEPADGYDFQAVAWSPDGKHLAAGSRGGLITVWDTEGRQVRGLRGHKGQVTAVAWSPDGKHLASAPGGLEEKAVKVWEVATGQEQRTLSTPRNFSQTSLSWSPDGHRLAAGGGDLYVWDCRSWAELAHLSVGGGSGEAVLAWRPDGKQLLTRGQPHLRVLEAERWQEAFVLTPSDGPGWGAAAWSPDSRRLAVVWQSGLTVLESDTGKELLKLDEKERRQRDPSARSMPVSRVDWDAGGKHLILSGGMEGWVVEAATGKVLSTHRGLSGPASPSPDGRHAARLTGGTIEVWDLQADRLVRTLGDGRGSALCCVAWGADRRLATGALSGTVKLWDVETGKETQSLRGLPEALIARSQAHLRSGGRVSSSDDSFASNLPSGLRALAFSPDGKRLAALSGAGDVKVWEAQGGKEVAGWYAGTTDREPPWRARPLYQSLAWSPDGRRLALGMGPSGRVSIRDAVTGKEERSLEAGGHALAWSPDGKHLAAAGTRDQPAAVWDMQSGKRLLTLREPQENPRFPRPSQITSLAWSPDGRRLLMAGDQSVTVWDPVAGEALVKLPKPQQLTIFPIPFVAWSPDGWKLAGWSSFPAATVTVWDATPPRP
jgi:WD40 repeat protein